MQEKKKPFVISISASSGGGKTTVSRRLLDALPNSALLSFDDFEEDIGFPQDLEAWLKSGADYNAFGVGVLKAKLQALKTTDVKTIVFDYPFGYANAEMAGEIDLSVFLNTPLDIAMARRIHRDLEKDDPEETERIFNELGVYEEIGRSLYLSVEEKVKPGCDVVVNAQQSPEEIVRDILAKMPV